MSVAICRPTLAFPLCLFFVAALLALHNRHTLFQRAEGFTPRNGRKLAKDVT